MFGYTTTVRLEIDALRLRELTLGNTSVNEIITSRRHFRHRDGRHCASALLDVLFSHLFPGHNGIACGNRYGVRVSLRTIDFGLREV